MDNTITVFDGNKFLWSKSSQPGVRVGVSEASDLGIFGRAPGAFFIQSHRTGKRVLFSFSEDLRDADGDVVAWVYSARFGGTEGQVDIHIIND